MPITLVLLKGSSGCKGAVQRQSRAVQLVGCSALRGWWREGWAVEVGTVLLCIFNDRPMPGARKSGKILFVTCWRCAEAPAPRLILGKMRMPAGWPMGLAGLARMPRWVLPWALLRISGRGHRVGSTLGSQQPAGAWVYRHCGTAPACWGVCGLRSVCGHPGASALGPIPACKGTTSFSSIPASGGTSLPPSASSTGWRCLLLLSGISVGIFLGGGGGRSWHLKAGAGTA